MHIYSEISPIVLNRVTPKKVLQDCSQAAQSYSLPVHIMAAPLTQHALHTLLEGGNQAAWEMKIKFLYLPPHRLPGLQWVYSTSDLLQLFCLNKFKDSQEVDMGLERG